MGPPPAGGGPTGGDAPAWGLPRPADLRRQASTVGDHDSRPQVLDPVHLDLSLLGRRAAAGARSR